MKKSNRHTIVLGILALLIFLFETPFVLPSFVTFVRKLKVVGLRFAAAIFLFTVGLFGLSPSYGLPSFPGAEGFGADNPGGRGKQVFIVTNLSGGNGAGSLRGALESAKSAGGGYIVFTVSGVIPLINEATVEDNITIAGQTSPGGIALDGTNASGISALTVGSYFQKTKPNNVIIRHIRIRGARYANDGIDIFGSNVVMDHVSISWYCDGAIDAIQSDNLTISWSMLGDAAECHEEGYHGLALLMNTCGNASIHHTLFHNSAERNPLYTLAQPDKVMDFRNNVIFNYRKYDSDFGGIAPDRNQANVVGNYWKPGSHTHGDENGKQRSVIIGQNDMSLYVSNNRHVEGLGQDFEVCTGTVKYCAEPRGNDAIVAAMRPDDTYDEWSFTGRFGAFGDPNSIMGPVAGELKKLDAPATAPAVTTYPVDQAYGAVLDKFGAFPRDNTDKRVEKEVRDGDGMWKKLRSVDNNTYTGTRPPGFGLADTDGDGMSDEWEMANGGLSLTPNGHENHAEYDNIEVYINALSDVLVGPIQLAISPRHKGAGAAGPLSLASANPFRNKITLNYQVENAGTPVQLAVYDLKGQLIKTLVATQTRQGNHSVAWNGKNNQGQTVKNGLYIARVKINNQTSSQKLMLLR